MCDVVWINGNFFSSYAVNRFHGLSLKHTKKSAFMHQQLFFVKRENNRINYPELHAVSRSKKQVRSEQSKKNSDRHREDRSLFMSTYMAIKVLQ